LYFCTSLRGNTTDTFIIHPNSISISGSKLSAKLGNQQEPSAEMFLSLIAYNDGTVRLQVDEKPEVGRFKVQDVLLPGLKAREQSWNVEKKASTKNVRVSISISPTADVNSNNNNSKSNGKVAPDVVSVELSFDPIKLELFRNQASIAIFNADKHFFFQHRREKRETDAEGSWAENFKTHHDSKPRGPQAISFDLRFPQTKHVYGLPERAAAFSLTPTIEADGKTAITEPYRLYNLDVFEYKVNSPFGLYGSIPFLTAHKKGQSVGAFWLNAAEMYVDVQKDAKDSPTQWIAESGVLDLFLMPGPSPANVAAQYARLTGGTALPQLFALGYHQCRWNYKDEEDIAQVDAGFDEHAIPFDVIWLDIEHTDGKRYFTWDDSYFPNPVAMQDAIASKERKMVVIIDPHIKRDTKWPLFKEAEEKGLYVKDKEGKDFDGWCWPGSSSYLDVTSPAARDWWADRFLLENYQGSTKNLYVWNDMNEPSVFNGPEVTMQKDNIHVNGAEHRDVHNAYGYFYHMASADGLVRRGRVMDPVDGDRPFVLSRAFFAGSQRIGAMWTGDNAASWEHLKVTVPMLLASNIAGMSFSGADVGGFFGNPDTELLVRWYQAAALTPFFRGHAHLETKRREPWLFGEYIANHIREAIQYRYRLMPYIYTQFLQANATGSPIMRPFWWEFPDLDESFYAEEEAYLLGPGLLVAPVLEQDAKDVRTPLPGTDMWYNAVTGESIDAGAVSAGENKERRMKVMINTMPTFFRGGHIIPMKERPRRSTAAMAKDPITLYIALNKAQTAVGGVFIDDGSSYAYKRGVYTYQKYVFENGQLKGFPATDTDLLAVGLPPKQKQKQQEKLPSEGVKIDRVVVLGLTGGPGDWQVTVTWPTGEIAGLEAQAGPIYAAGRTQIDAPALVVRKPGLPVDGAWTLSFFKSAQQHTIV
jgi:alpha 1,3-glucosidase